MKNDQRLRLRSDTDFSMALSFFHGGQLARGVQAQEGESSTHAQSLRRLYSETALQEQLKSDAGSLRSGAHSRPRTSQRGDYKSTRLNEQPSVSTIRPSTGYQNRHGLSLHPPDASRPRTADPHPATDPTVQHGSHQTTVTSDAPPAAPSRWVNILKNNPLKGSALMTNPLKNVKKPSFTILRREPPTTDEKPRTPKSPDKRSWKAKEAERRRARLVEEALGSERNEEVEQEQERPDRMASRRTVRTQASAAAISFATPRVDTPVAAQAAPNPSQFLAESLAHVIVGEWLYKDPHKPGLFPQSNILQRQNGPRPRGATGVPQRRWFRIDPYERQLLWSSKWDSMETSQHKQNRKGETMLSSFVRRRSNPSQCQSSWSSKSPTDWHLTDAYQRMPCHTTIQLLS
jgi:hypothetical protein